jgi:hypothetical protein
MSNWTQLIKTYCEALIAKFPDQSGGKIPVTDAAVLAKLSSDPATQTTLAAILAKLIAAPATEAKQDTGNNSLSSIDGKLAKGTQHVAAALSTNPADDIPDGRYIGDIKFAEELPAGTQLLGKVGIDQTTPGTTNAVAGKDNGPQWTVTRTYTTSADMTTAAAISPTAGEGMKLVADDILVSAAAAMEFSIQQETEATVFASVFIPANGTVQITLRDGLKTTTAVRKFYGKASVAGNVRIACCTHEEA